MKRATRRNWQTVEFTAVVVKTWLGNIVIIPVIGPDDEAAWQRFDCSKFWEGWSTPTTDEVVTEVDASYLDKARTVRVIQEDLEEPVNPFHL